MMIRCSSCDACRNDQISSDLAVHLCIVKRWHEGFQNKWLLTFNRSEPSVLFNIDGDGVLGLHFSSYAEEFQRSDPISMTYLPLLPFFVMTVENLRERGLHRSEPGKPAVRSGTSWGLPHCRTPSGRLCLLSSPYPMPATHSAHQSRNAQSVAACNVRSSSGHLRLCESSHCAMICMVASSARCPSQPGSQSPVIAL